MKNIRLQIAAALSISLLLAVPALSDVPDAQKAEVLHLIQFVETTDCAFERNGKKHSGEEAAKHINRKYGHFRGQITTTEEFIEYSASKSTMSGKEYLVYCGDDAPITSQEWLLEELSAYRAANQ